MVRMGVIRGGATKEEVLSKKFNIYIGVSLGNRWFQNKQNLKEYIQWGLTHTKERLGIEIADTLHAINLQYKDGFSTEAARRKALKEGDKIIEMLREILSELPKEDVKKIDIIRWDEITDNKEYKKEVSILNKFFNEYKAFKEEIKSIVKDFAKRSDRNWTDERIDNLCLYILNELPECLSGFSYKNIVYNCWIYPNDGGDLTKLIEDIQLKKRFAELHKMFDIGKSTFVELIVE